MPLVSKTFSEIITFTRASTATFFGSTGLLTSAATNAPRFDYNPATLAAQGLLIEEQRVNLLTYSNYFDNAAWTKTGTISVAANTVTSITGNVDADTLTTISGGVNRVSQATTVAVSTSYAVSLFVKSGDINGVTFRLFFSGGTSIDTYADFIFSSATFTNVLGAGTFTQQPIGNGWYRITCVLASGNNTAIDLRVGGLITTVQTGSTAYLYGAQLEAGSFATSYAPSVNTFTSRASTGSYFDATGTLQSAAINVARNTYNPANLLAQPFLLLEEARTNSIRNNTMVGAVAGTPGTLPTNWASLGAGLGTLTQTIVATGASAGISYIDVRISGTTSTNSFGISFEQTTQISAASGQNWASSVYLARVGGTTSNLTVSQRVVERNAVGVGLINTSSNVTASLGNSLLRFSVTRSLTDATTAFITTDVLFDFITGVAIDITLRIGLPQLELGAFATSVIPTSTVALTRSADISSSAQATRAADVASVNTLSPWYNASEGTLYAEYNIPYALTTGSSPRFFTLMGTGGAAIDEMPLFTNQAAGKAASFNSFAASVNAGRIDSTPAFVANTVTKAAAGYATNNRAVTSGGAAPTTSSTVYTIPTITTARLGAQDSLGNSTLNGWLRRLSYYPRKLSDAELQSLTT